MLCLPSICSLFHNKFDKFNDAGACILDPIYHMTLNAVTLKSQLGLAEL